MKVALIGSAPSSVGLAPFKDSSYAKFVGGKVPQYPVSKYIDDDWEIWGCSPGAWSVVPRVNRWFEVHRWEPGADWLSPQYVEFLKGFTGGPVYTGGPVPEIPAHVVYPIERVEDEFSSYFLTSSLALMLALAILEIEESWKAGGPRDQDVIGLWGVDMAANDEYGYQRPGCHHFILEAIERGIGVFVPPESDLLRPMPVYGLSEWDAEYIKLTARSRELNQRRTARQAELDKAKAELAFLQGASDDLNYMVNTWTSKYDLPAGQVIRKKPECMKLGRDGPISTAAYGLRLEPGDTVLIGDEMFDVRGDGTLTSGDGTLTDD